MTDDGDAEHADGTTGPDVVDHPAADEPAAPTDAGPVPHADSTAPPSVVDPEHELVDLDAVERDLDAVETALERLAEGTYGTDEVTGEPIPDSILEADPTARRA